jgi:hypothetical protein
LRRRFGPSEGSVGAGATVVTVEVVNLKIVVEVVVVLVSLCVVMNVLIGVAAVCVIMVVVDPVATAEQALDKRGGDQVLTDAGVCTSRLFAAMSVVVVRIVLEVTVRDWTTLVTETVWTEVTTEVGGVATMTIVDTEGMYEM